MRTVMPGCRSIEAHDEVDDLPGDEWDSLLGGDGFFLSRRWLRVVQRTARVPLCYLLLRDAGRLVAALPTAELDGTAPWLLGRPDTLLAHAANEGMAGAAECRAGLGADLATALLPGLVCGGRHLGRTRVLCREPAAAAEVHELVADAERLASGRGLRSVSFLHVDDGDVLLRAVLSERGYRSHESARYCWMPVPDGGFDGYLCRFSAHRARRMRAERRRIAAAGVRVSVEPLSAAMLPRLAELETELFRKYGFLDWRPELSQGLLEEVLDEFGAEAVVSLARSGEVIRGFGLLLRHGDQWFAYRAGFDYGYQSGGGLPLYYELLYYAPVELAGAAGVRAIHYGVGSVEAKLSRGCVASAQHSYLRLLG